MPIPKPNPGESRDDYISRCMSAQEGEDRDQEQKLAICFDTFRQSKKSDLINATKKLDKVMKQENFQGSTSVDNDHFHGYSVNENGDGYTIVTTPESDTPHVHKIKKWEVQTENGHKHSIPKG